jgi:NTE family protein
LQSGVLWRFSRPYARDWRVGKISNPTIDLATAVAASSAFPPFVSPVILEMDEAAFEPGSGDDLQFPPYTTRVHLTDGGVYDNLGLETAWKKYQTVLVSDGGGKMEAEDAPHTDWARHAIRINDIIDNQVRSLRTRQVIGSFETGDRTGTYWGIRSDISEYGAPDALPCPFEQTTILARTPTRLKRLDDGTQEQIINWGYAICDAAMRRHVDTAIPAPAGFPYPGAAV